MADHRRALCMGEAKIGNDSLEIRQQPIRARMCGFGDKVRRQRDFVHYRGTDIPAQSTPDEMPRLQHADRRSGSTSHHPTSLYPTRDQRCQHFARSRYQVSFLSLQSLLDVTSIIIRDLPCLMNECSQRDRHVLFRALRRLVVGRCLERSQPRPTLGHLSVHIGRDRRLIPTSEQCCLSSGRPSSGFQYSGESTIAIWAGSSPLQELTARSYVDMTTAGYVWAELWAIPQAIGAQLLSTSLQADRTAPATPS